MASDSEFRLGVLWCAWWLHQSHGEDNYARDILLEAVGRHGIASMRALARKEGYQFKRGFWALCEAR